MISGEGIRSSAGRATRQKLGIGVSGNLGRRGRMDYGQEEK